MARSLGGRWLVRMEDLDTPRVVPGMADDILRTLETLGLLWDGEVVWQSRRQAAYEAALDRLVRDGYVYPCGCSRAEIARIATAPHAGEEGPAYPGLCRAGLLPGRKARALRLRVETGPISFVDGIQGIYCQDLAEYCGDFVVRRADGPVAYHLAVVVDDAEAGVTQVVRGADLLSSTPRQILLQRLLGLPTPTYHHLPLVTNADGTKLSKRDHAVSLTTGLDIGKRGGELLLAALRFLGQLPPSSLCGAPCVEVLAWAVAHFNPGLIPQASTSPMVKDQAP
jgi:glutamyl-Q tRNA(Asp) synthetase